MLIGLDGKENSGSRQGDDMRFLQDLSGHKSSKTTERYTHVSRDAFNKIASPLDGLKLSDE